MKNSNEIKETIKRFVTVIQISAYKFDVFFFDGESESRLYPQTSLKGVTVHACESNKHNDKYCFKLANDLNMGRTKSV